MELRKSVASGLAALLVTCGLGLAVASTPALADDGVMPMYSDASTEDHAFNLQIDVSSAWGTPWRHKEDTTPVYMNIQSMGWVDWCYIYTDGSNDQYNAVNLTNNGRGYLSHSGQYEIWNWINENGYYWARITATRESNGGVVSGLWSPDCAGSYNVLNP